MPLCLHFLSHHQEALALFLYTILALTDHWDGLLARRWNACSHLGVILDQVSDKLVGLGFFTGLFLLGICPLWYVIFSFSLALILGIGCLLEPQPSLKIGKWSMALQFVWIGWIILWKMLSHLSNLDWLSEEMKLFNQAGFMFLAGLQIITLKCYVSRFLKTHPEFLEFLFSE
jgi:phosphatidylglycerophosphate synthase